MSTVQEQAKATDVVYDLKGSLLEACSCGVLCPCWIGEDPDRGTCEAVIAWHFDEGVVRGVDVSGLTLAGVVIIPGNILAGNWKVALFVDENATAEQEQAILDAYTGKLGGALADLSQLIGEVVTVSRAPISHELHDGDGTLKIGDMVSSEMSPYRGPSGQITTLNESIFSTVPGSPAYVSKAIRTSVNLPEYGMVWSYEDANAIQSDYHMTHVESK
jgi:hypothetical protein